MNDKQSYYFCYNYDQFCYLFFDNKIKYIFSGKTKDDKPVTIFPRTIELNEAIKNYKSIKQL